MAWKTQVSGRISKPFFKLIANAPWLFVCTEQDGDSEPISKLIVLDLQTGDVAWSHSFPPRLSVRHLSLIDGAIVPSSESLSTLGGHSAEIHTYNTTNGAVLWQTTLTAHSFSAPHHIGNLLLFNASDHHIYALNAADGSQAWVSERLASWSPIPTTADENSIYVGGYTNKITRVMADGTCRELFASASKDDWFDLEMHVAKGVLYAPCSNRMLYAIDVKTGALRWSKKMGRGFSAPLRGVDRLYVPIKGQGRGRYLLMGISAETGQTQWQFECNKHILTPPLIHEGHLFFGTRSGTLHALDAATGDALWQIDTGKSIRGAPTVAGLHVYFGTEDGGIYAVRWRDEPEEGLKSAEFYRHQNDWLLAGTAAAHARQWGVAAADFDKADHPYEAAQLFEQAEQLDAAAARYAQTEHYDHAIDLYQRLGDKPNEAALWLKSKQPAQAAKIYTTIGAHLQAARAYLAITPPDYAKAARCFEQAESWREAGHAFLQAGQVDAAVGVWRKSDRPHLAADLLRDQGRLAEAVSLRLELGDVEGAAELQLELGKVAEAVELYRKLGNDQRALQIATDHLAWDVVSKLAREMGHYEEEATACLALAERSPSNDYHHFRAAASAFVRAAKDHETREDKLLIDSAIAKLWEQAAHYFDKGFFDDKALIIQCRREAYRLRRWPEIVLNVQAERQLTIAHWDRLIVKIKNIGDGLGRLVNVKVIDSDFEGKMDTQIFGGLLPNHTIQMRLNVRPRSAGSSVPLDIRLSYTRPNGEEIRRVIHAQVFVHDRNSRTCEGRHHANIDVHRDDSFDKTERQTIIVQGDYITVGNISEAQGIAIGKSASAKRGA
ncbi:MAG: PQQ-binding-like beta-propeller repeat protein [Candidatus Promineifilaceae bacterium]